MTGPRSPGEVDRSATVTGLTRPFRAVAGAIVWSLRAAVTSSIAPAIVGMAITGAILWLALEPFMGDMVVAASEPVTQETMGVWVDLFPLVFIVGLFALLTIPLLSR